MYPGWARADLLRGLVDAYWATATPARWYMAAGGGTAPTPPPLHAPDPADDVAALGRVALHSPPQPRGQVRLRASARGMAAHGAK